MLITITPYSMCRGETLKLSVTDAMFIAIALAVFWAGILWQIDLPGIYMDAVNPDFLAAYTLHPALHNPRWALPDLGIPFLGGVYFGLENYYLDLAVLPIVGSGVAGIRIAQALFGAAIVVALYFLAATATKNRVVAFAVVAGLATDIAFLASFRTKFYVIVSGDVWLLVSLLLLWRGGRKTLFVSGVCYGLAIYAYFVFGFFAPAIGLIAIIQANKHARIWAAGFATGLLPYVLGYVSFVAAFGNPIDGIVTLVGQSAGLLRTSSSYLPPLQTIQHDLLWARLAIDNGGNELMTFSRVLGGDWGLIKAAVFALIAIILLFRIPRDRAAMYMMLPASFLAIATNFGARLWVHHFSVLVPIAYLLLAVFLGTALPRRTGTILAAVCAVVFIGGNVYQAAAFHGELTTTGGIGKSSDVLTRLADDARADPGTLYVFPEWGFFMPFALETENGVPYVLDLTDVNRAKVRSRRIALAFWSKSSEPKYREALAALGIVQICDRAYRQRDGQPAFWVMYGNINPGAAPAECNLPAS